MRVLLVNGVCGIRSTGRICTDIATSLEKNGDEVKIGYGRENVPEQFQKYAIRIGTNFDNKLHGLQSRIFDNSGFGSVRATKQFILWANEYDPDMIWLHNIHGYYINVEILFQWIKSRPNMKVRWTLHDCWAFTGHCSHFDCIGCDRWKTQCYDCPQKGEYPTSILCDASERNYKRKKEAFTNVKDMVIFTPSQWLADLVKDSYLKDYTVEVHHNTVDATIFHPRESDFRKKNRLEDKTLILGVATAWGEGKGLYDFYKLSEMLDDKYKIVLVGLTHKQLKHLPKKILGVESTCNKQELAEIYSTADVFFNPTYADTYPTVNLEAEACGTRVITYCIGGAPETISREDSIVIPKGEYKRLKEILEEEH